MNVLCLDIGSGTQDAFLFQSQESLQNCPKFVLPSPARLVGRQIERLTERREAVYLYGRIMGGGFGHQVQAHLDQGLPVAAHPEAALSLTDNVDKLPEQGIAVSESCPSGYRPVYLADFDPGFWRCFLAQADLEMPDLTVAAVQDHGFHPQSSNRLGRFSLWTELLEQTHGRVQDLVFQQPPGNLTRLCTLQELTGGGPVADTGAAAVLGALFVPEIEARNRERGVLVVNVGNSHTIAFLVYEDRIFGIFEHHTGLLSPEKLWSYMERFATAELGNEEVFDDLGHGCMTTGSLPRQAVFDSVIVLGPQRDMLQGYPVSFPAPGGDMMLAGAFGLLKGWRLHQEEQGGS